MGHEQPIAEADVEGPVRHKLTVEEFLILDEAGAFGDRRVELIDGEIFVLSPIHVPHSRTKHRMGVAFDRAVERLTTTLECFSPVSAFLDEHSLPEADLLVAEPGDLKFMSPGAIRIALEVSASSLRHDLVRKAALYARSGLPEYWVVDVNGRRIIRLWNPVDGQYAERADFAFGVEVPSATIPGLVVDTASL